LSAKLSQSEEFIALFNNLKAGAGNNPERVLVFYKDSKAIRDALDALHAFLARTDLERRVFHGRKLFVPRAAGFETAWKDYDTKWRFRVWSETRYPEGYKEPEEGIFLSEDDIPSSEGDAYPNGREAYRRRLWAKVENEPGAFDDGLSFVEFRQKYGPLVYGSGLPWEEKQIEAEVPTAEDELHSPDPESENSFDPRSHDGGAALSAGIDYLEDEAITRPQERVSNLCRLAVDAYDYLTETIGLDVHDIFRRWRKVPVILMPAHVASRYAASDKGSLSHLLDDAVRAYVLGAPAAAITMCRAALEMVLKQHYGHDQWNNEKLENLIVLASKRYDFIQYKKIDPIRDKANKILHRYHSAERISEEDDLTIINFLKTLRFLIERAPAR
jgi:hypothetical protein